MPPFSRTLAILLPLATAGCFSSSSAQPGASTIPGDDASPDATVPDSSGPASDAGGSPVDGAAPCEAGGPCSGDSSSPPRVCPHSTCTAVKVVFQGWIVGADGGIQTVEIAADTATADGGANAMVVRTASPTDPALGQENLLVGDFVTSAEGGVEAPLLYANDNNYCDVPDFGGRTNEYYLAPSQGLPVDVSLFHAQCGCGGNCGAPCGDGGGLVACDFESTYYSQSCPNFGFNCVVTPRKIEAIQFLPAGGDATCEVCLYSDTTGSAAHLIRCNAPGTSLSAADLYGAGDGGAAMPLTPALLRLDDGSSCASY